MDTIYILQLEDSLIDAELSLSILTGAGIPYQARRVETEQEYRASLLETRPDVILADYALPEFDGISALKLAQIYRPDTPFIFVSGKMGEELAVDCLHSGATDFVLKQRLQRLVPAVRRALAEVEVRAARKRMEREREAREREEDAREAAELQARQLAKLNEQLEQFAYAASHDLQQPLRTVRASASYLVAEARHLLNADALLYLGEIERGIETMQRLIEGLLAYSKSVHEVGFRREAASLSEVLAQVMERFKYSIEESGATVTADPLPVLNVDRERIASVFQNLISNALKYRAERTPSIHISARENEDHWIIEVRDNGIGFEPRHAERIFGMFKRLHSDDFPGTGIGLALAKKVVEEHGGRIWADAEPDKGATFSFSLPAKVGRGYQRAVAGGGGMAG